VFKSRRPRRRPLVGVPRGILYYIVLSALHYRPISGSEIIEEIEEVTGWRPSSGSIYPLLAKLRREGSIEQVESDKPGLKYFTLTAKGREELEDHKKRGDIFRDRYRSIRRIYLKLIKEMDEDLYNASLRLFNVIEEADAALKEKRETSEKVQSILNKTAEEIEKIKKEVEDVQ
jgi:PadR family transcriptional regulator PadR